MKIDVICMMYQEEMLAGLFCDHYKFVDTIHIIYDTDTSDNTKAICEQYPNVIIHPYTFPDMMDDALKQEQVNKMAAELDVDWILAVDADEFIFNKDTVDTVRAYLEESKETIISVTEWQVYKHVTENKICSYIPALLQRRYGDKGTAFFQKPCVIRGRLGISWQAGCHILSENIPYPVLENGLQSTHWCNADIDLAIHRRIYGRKLRQSKYNLETGLSCHNHNITEDDIIAVCKAHEHDPLLF